MKLLLPPVPFPSLRSCMVYPTPRDELNRRWHLAPLSHMKLVIYAIFAVARGSRPVLVSSAPSPRRGVAQVPCPPPPPPPPFLPPKIKVLMARSSIATSHRSHRYMCYSWQEVEAATKKKKTQQKSKKKKKTRSAGPNPSGCPCGSKKNYSACCAPLHAGTANDATPADVMRCPPPLLSAVPCHPIPSPSLPLPSSTCPIPSHQQQPHVHPTRQWRSVDQKKRGLTHHGHAYLSSILLWADTYRYCLNARARFSAYSKGIPEYIVSSTHLDSPLEAEYKQEDGTYGPGFLAEAAEFCEKYNFKKLSILQSPTPAEGSEEATVLFKVCRCTAVHDRGPRPSPCVNMCSGTETRLSRQSRNMRLLVGQAHASQIPTLSRAACSTCCAGVVQPCSKPWRAEHHDRT